MYIIYDNTLKTIEFEEKIQDGGKNSQIFIFEYFKPIKDEQIEPSMNKIWAVLRKLVFSAWVVVGHFEKRQKTHFLHAAFSGKWYTR